MLTLRRRQQQRWHAAKSRSLACESWDGVPSSTTTWARKTRLSTVIDDCVCARVCVSSRVRVKQGCGGCLRVRTARSRQRDEWGEAKAEAAGPNACCIAPHTRDWVRAKGSFAPPPFHPPFVAFAPFLQALCWTREKQHSETRFTPLARGSTGCVRTGLTRVGCAADGGLQLLCRKVH